MSTPQDSQQLKIEDIPADNGPQRQNPRLRAGSDNCSTKTQTSHSCEEESTPLLGNTPRRCCMKVKSKFRSRRCCLWSSKAVLIIIIWNLVITVGLISFLNPAAYIYLFPDYLPTIPAISGSTYGFTGFLFLFYPLAGCLADIRWGRHKTVVNSLCFILWSLVLMLVLIGLASIGIVPLMNSNPLNITAIVVVFVVFGLPCLFGLILLFCSLIAFSANVIQYGMDQLHDAPTDDSVLYIHWYVWTIFMGLLIVRFQVVLFNYWSYWYIVSALCPGLALFLLAITLCIQKYKQRWFLIESGSRNPYKLVFKVLKFAKDHTNPIRRSAFTYCEDELPSRLDFGKEKYGGPFANEQVENVKAFIGILGVLLTTGPTFIADFAINGILSLMATDMYDYYSGANSKPPIYSLLYSTGCLTPLMVVMLVPLYLILLRPFISHYIPGMLKRIGLGMIMFLLSGLCTLLMGSFRHDYTMYFQVYCPILDYLKVSEHFLILQSSLNAIGYMLFNIATFEFICAQSPHSMKGLLIGTFFAIKGVFQLIGAVAVFIPVMVWCKIKNRFPVCGFIYYLINVVIILIGLIAFVIVARKYQYRERDEPDNIYRYAEEYYANAQDEPNYDYDDYDNLNVETITN